MFERREVRREGDVIVIDFFSSAEATEPVVTIRMTPDEATDLSRDLMRGVMGQNAP